MTLTDDMQAENRVAGNRKPDAKQLVIGLDFGAAYTRVVIGDRHVRYAVPFGEFAHADNQYLLPSILDIDDQDICSLSSADNSNGATENLKFPLLNDAYTVDDLIRVSAYLALVFRAATGWLLERYKKRYAHAELSWMVNAGLAADSSINPELSVVYKKFIHTAWVVSVLPGPVSLNRVCQYMAVDESAFEAFPAVYRSRIISEERINTFPGCCAQICGYARSKKCTEDLHLLIDIGAATVNIATFYANSETDIDGGKHRCDLYACAVEPIGVNYLLKRRYENLKLSDKKIDLFKDIPDNRAFAQAHDLTEKDITFADTLYSGEVARLISRVLAVTKKQYRPDPACWEGGVLAFTYGGGAHMEIVQSIVRRFESRKPPHRIRTIRLSPPDDLMAENLPVDSFDRLSVAYGLSFEPGKIGNTIKQETVRTPAAVAEV